jgi:sugar phosphate isomerase/epimerase
MKLSCLPVSFFPQISDGRMSFREWGILGKELRLDAIDLGFTLLKAHTVTYLEQVVRELEEAGIGVAMITDYPDFTNPSRVQREREIEYLRSDIAVASQIGARYLRVTAGQAHPGTAIKEQIGNAVECLKRVSSVAERFKVTLVLENHSKPGAWKWYDITYDPAVFVDVVDAVRETGIRVNFDTANTVAWGGDPVGVLRAVKGLVETVHASDTRAPGVFEPVVIGTGAVPFLEIFKELRLSGFDNWICIEEWSNTGKSGLESAVRFVRGAWEASRAS